jgi:hypothetical protein
MNDDNYLVISHEPSEDWNFFDCWVIGKPLTRFVLSKCPLAWPACDGNRSYAGLSRAALEETFAYMRAHDIPAREPRELPLLMRLIKAGVRLID